MAYKRKSKKTGQQTRQTTTLNTNKGITHSKSTGAGNYRRTISQNKGTNKITEVIRRADGYVTRKQRTISGKSSKPKNNFGPKSKKNKVNQAFTTFFLGFCGIVWVINYLINLIFGG